MKAARVIRVKEPLKVQELNTKTKRLADPS
jgi:hypothetical protein